MRVAMRWLAAFSLASGGASPAGVLPAFAAEPALPPPAAAQPAAAGPSGATPRAAPRHRGPQDPMEFLRERLAARLGGAALDASGAGMIRVVNRAGDAAAPPAGAALAVAAKPASRASQGALPAAPGARRQATTGVPAWGYEGAGGPAHWARLAPEFATCARGSRQSPIDIQGGIEVDLEPIGFDYRASGFRVIDDGHSVRVDLDPGNAIEVLGRRYELQQFHFHRPAEESIDGRRFAMVAHLVHRAADGRLAVVAVLLEPGSANAAVQAVWNNLPLEKGEPVVARRSLELAALLPEERGYYTYMGSLTTPPCTEGVLWMVMRQPVALSAEQIAIFARLYPMNARPLQEAAGRLIKQSN